MFSGSPKHAIIHIPDKSMTTSDFSITLLRPEIPHNTGAIGRLAVGLGVRLNLVRPLGFRLDDESIRRAGLDYWPHLDCKVHDTWDSTNGCIGNYWVKE